MFECRGANEKVMLSLPKCLHSIIRFQITPPPAGPGSMPGGSGGEVRIMTEPKMLALPPSTFSSPAIPYPRQRTGAVGYEDGWVDGEDLGDLRDGQGSGSEGEGEDEDPASWLEGRFQALVQLLSYHVHRFELTWDAIGPLNCA